MHYLCALGQDIGIAEEEFRYSPRKAQAQESDVVHYEAY